MFYDIIFEIIDRHCIKKTFCNNKYSTYMVWFDVERFNLYEESCSHIIVQTNYFSN